MTVGTTLIYVLYCMWIVARRMFFDLYEMYVYIILYEYVLNRVIVIMHCHFHPVMCIYLFMCHAFHSLTAKHRCETVLSIKFILQSNLTFRYFILSEIF